MKVFIREYCRDVTVRIYGVDGEERTREFFEKYFSEVDGVYETTEEEHTKYCSEAEFTIERAEHYNFFAQQIDNIQRGIDDVAEALMRGEDIHSYAFDGYCYTI